MKATSMRNQRQKGDIFADRTRWNFLAKFLKIADSDLYTVRSFAISLVVGIVNWRKGTATWTVASLLDGE